jgi:NAD(P)-dependent dehydrogenase (short-subunit alcohol dehydrogenase family)
MNDDSEKNPSNAPMDGRVSVITGANSGIGKATALALARLGATVVLACRNQERAEAARKEILSETNNPEVSVALVDLSDLKSVRTFAADFQKKFPKLHVLVNNAGIYTSKRIVTVDGFESTFATNHLGHFLLTELLLDELKAHAPSRIINVSSDAHLSGHVDFNDLQGERKYGGMKSYAQSKLANVLFTYELAKRLDGTGVTANCVHPGVVRTNFGRDGGGLMSVGVRIGSPFMLSPEAGARTVVWLASSPEVEQVTGKYFVKESERRSSKESYDIGVARHLWDVSSELALLSPK